MLSLTKVGDSIKCDVELIQKQFTNSQYTCLQISQSSFLSMNAMALPTQSDVNCTVLKGCSSLVFFKSYFHSFIIIECIFKKLMT